MPSNLRTTFRAAPHTQALLDGRVTSELVNLQFVPVEPISRAFRRALRGDEFDVTEMALVTLAMAVDAGLPWVGLPIVVMRGFHHAALRTLNGSAVQGPRDLVGKRIGVRAYSQTTGVWVRGILQQDFGVAPDQMAWVTTEDAHVAGFTDPSYVVRANDGAKLPEMLATGEIAAGIGDGSTSFAESRPVIANPEKAAAEWHQRTGVYPVNHLIAVRREVVEKGEVYRMFEAARLYSSAADDLPYGRETHEKSINMGLEFAFAQGLTRRLLRYEDLFWIG